MQDSSAVIEELRTELSRKGLELEFCRDELRKFKTGLKNCSNCSKLCSSDQSDRGQGSSVIEKEDKGKRFKSFAGPLQPQDPEENVTIISNLLSSKGVPMEITIEEAQDAAERHALAISFVALAEQQTLQEYALERSEEGEIPLYPSQEGTMRYISPKCVKELKMKSVEHATTSSTAIWCTTTFRQEWKARIKNLLAGNYCPLVMRNVVFANVEEVGDKSVFFTTITWPIVLVDSSTGQRHWGMMLQVLKMGAALEHAWGMRDLLSIKHTPACISIVSKDTGRLLWQNSASMAMFGCHGLFHSEVPNKLGAGFTACCGPATGSTHQGSRDFIELLLSHGQEEHWAEELEEGLTGGRTFRKQVEISHPVLRQLMGLRKEEEAHQDVQITLSRDPVTLQRVFTISQVDITSAVIAKRELQQAHAQLAEEKIRTEALLCRQHELIECLGWVSEVRRSARGDARASELIGGVWKQMVDVGLKEGADSRSSGKHHDVDEESITILDLVDEGSYGKVYHGIWHGMQVAVKSMVLPIKLSGAEHRERMAIMEAAISSSLSHPNIVKTHTYSLKSVRDSGGRSSCTSPLILEGSHSEDRSSRSRQGSVSAFQVQIVQELCNRGSLREALDQGTFHNGPGGSVNYSAVLHTALDIAKGMRHLHSCNILHSDLKALNVLLQSNAESQKGFTAKVADFGLSVKMLHSETHVSNMFQGTITHMAPETLLTGQQSNAADVYAYGITLWEMYTGRHAFKGVSQAMLGHLVAHEHIRPQFPSGTPCEVEVVCELCWQNSPASRPSFEEIEAILHQMCEAAGPCDIPVPARVPGKPAEYNSFAVSAPLDISTTVPTGREIPLMQSWSHQTLDTHVSEDPLSASKALPTPFGSPTVALGTNMSNPVDISATQQVAGFRRGITSVRVPSRLGPYKRSTSAVTRVQPERSASLEAAISALLRRKSMPVLASADRLLLSLVEAASKGLVALQEEKQDQ